MGQKIPPQPTNLFLINPKPTLLDDETATLLHHLITKLLFWFKHACPDIQMAVAFLTTQVQCPDVDDYKKLTVLCAIFMVLRRTH